MATGRLFDFEEAQGAGPRERRRRGDGRGRLPGRRCEQRAREFVPPGRASKAVGPDQARRADRAPRWRSPRAWPWSASSSSSSSSPRTRARASPRTSRSASRPSSRCVSGARRSRAPRRRRRDAGRQRCEPSQARGARWSRCSGRRLNVLDLPMIRALHHAVRPRARRRDLKVLVLRSALPGPSPPGWTCATTARTGPPTCWRRSTPSFRLLDALPQATVAARGRPLPGRRLRAGRLLRRRPRHAALGRSASPRSTSAASRPSRRVLLPRARRAARAFEMVLDGRAARGAAEAARIGLVTRVVRRPRRPRPSACAARLAAQERRRAGPRPPGGPAGSARHLRRGPRPRTERLYRDGPPGHRRRGGGRARLPGEAAAALDGPLGRAHAHPRHAPGRPHGRRALAPPRRLRAGRGRPDRRGGRGAGARRRQGRAP